MHSIKLRLRQTKPSAKRSDEPVIEWAAAVRSFITEEPASAAADEVDLPQLPLHCFGAGFYRLFSLHDENLNPEDLSETPHLDLSTGGIYPVKFGEDPTQAAISHLVDRWWDHYGQRKVRAAQLLKLTDLLSSPLPALEAEPTSYSQAIALGRLLQRLHGQTIAGRTLHARTSGNSSAYWLTCTTLSPF
jgi:hypothetical protein